MMKYLVQISWLPLVVLLLFSCSYEYIDAPPEPTRVSNRSKPQEGADEPDKKFYVNNPDFTDRFKFCARKTWADSAQTANCLRQMFEDLSSVAAGCFGELAACGRSNCKWSCLADDNSEKCKLCARSECGDAWASCIGSPVNDLPQ